MSFVRGTGSDSNAGTGDNGLAARRYQEKHGHAPNTCFINAAQNAETLGAEGLRVNGVVVKGLRSIMPHYFWLGVEEEQKDPAWVA